MHFSHGTTLPFLFLLITLLRSHSAFAAPQTPVVMVMPFRDLSAGSRPVGEAIRETVTTDLKQLGALRVVERSSLDRLLLEQKLQAHRQELDISVVIRLGKVLGASLIVLGAYQEVPPLLRLTARIVKVETGEILGTTKVDGPSRDFLRLQDRISATLLRAAGLPLAAQKFDEEATKRADLASLSSLSLYGQAVMAPTEMERLRYLQAVIGQESHFAYAVEDLAALEQRMERYQSAAKPILDRELELLRRQSRDNPDPAAASLITLQLLSRLATQNQWHTLVRSSREFLGRVPTDKPLPPYADGVAMMLIQYDGALKDPELVLRDGEQLLRRTPSGTTFAIVSAAIQRAIERKRSLEESRQKTESEIAELDHSQRWDLCRIGDLCRNQEQYSASLRFYEACKMHQIKPAKEVFPLLVLSASNGGLWRELRRLLGRWEQLDAAAAHKWRVDNQGWYPEDE